MADLDYVYAPYYGVEPFDPATVGAVFTGHNLVVTVWNVLDKSNEGVPVSEVLLQPASQNANLISQRQTGGGAPAMSSRCSAQMFFMPDPAAKAPLQNTQLFVLNPPPELRQQWAQNVSFNGGNTLDPADYTVLRSLLGGYTWYVRAEEIPTEAQTFVFEPTAVVYEFGTPYDLGNYDGTGSGSWLPLLRTNGADGQPPEFFDFLTAQGVADMLAAVNAGEFFLPLLLESDFSNALRVTITYPHSVARG